MKKQIRRTALVLSAIFTLAIAFTSTAVAQDDAAALYKAKCASCHAADGSGDTPVGKKMGVKALNSPEVAKNSDAAWTEATKKGKGKMPAYESKLTDDQIKELVKYMRGLAKGK
ncbi:MAG: cytochrome c [Acidobacteriia bacterium]|nr:cytochrome c [Terriglobia bacterium]